MLSLTCTPITVACIKQRLSRLFYPLKIMMKKISNWLFVVFQAGLLVGPVTVLANDRVYVASEGADTVSVLDGVSLQTQAKVRVGQMPHNVQVSPDGKHVWVTNNGEPRQADAAAHSGADHGAHQASTKEGAVWVVDTTSNAVTARISVGKDPAHVVISPDGRRAYVTNGGDNTVSVIDASNKQLITTLSVGLYPHGLRVSPDGKEVYVANLKGGTVSIIDTAALAVVAHLPVGKGPAQTGFTPDGRWAFVSLSQENAVAVIDPATRQVQQKIAVGNVPIQIYATPDSRTLLVANQGTRSVPGKTVSWIDLASSKVVRSIVTGLGAHGVVIDRGGRFAYVTNIYGNSVSQLDLKDGKVLKTVSVAKEPNGISLMP